MSPHSIKEFVQGFGAKLAAKSRHVCVLLGAGVGAACGLPDVNKLEKAILKDLTPEECELLKKQLKKGDLETALSRLRRITTLIGEDDTVDGLTKERAADLDRAICRAIVKKLEIDQRKIDPIKDFTAWIGRASYSLPVEIFTVNYDLLLETAMDRQGVPYFDGFVGNLEGSFQTSLVEAAPTDRGWIPSFFVRLWKLHGSVNWAQRESKVVRLGAKAGSEELVAIYPSDAKYKESRRMPFVVLQDRLRKAVETDETFLIVAGYSFGDEHLNEILFDAARRRERSELMVFCYKNIHVDLEQAALSTPNVQVLSPKEAIIGGQRKPWNKSEEALDGIWENGRFLLGDFAKLGPFLARSVSSHSNQASYSEIPDTDGSS